MEVGGAMELTEDTVAMAAIAEVMEVTAIMGRDLQQLKQGMATVAMEVMVAMEDMVVIEGMVMVVMVAMEAMVTTERGLPLQNQKP